MGAYLSKPEKEKTHEIGENELIRFSSCSMQGWRINQEDAHNCIVDFAPGISFFAVYDGHGGREVSKYLAETFPNYLKEKDLLAYDNVQKKLEELFVDFDANLCNEETIKIMSKMKEEEKKTDEIVNTEEAEQKEKEALYEEAIALSQEANVSLETIIKQYAKCRTFIMEKSAEAEGSRGSKRGVSAPSPQILKRRKVKDGEVVDTKGGVEENGDDQQKSGKNDEKMDVQKENEKYDKSAENLKKNRTEKNTGKKEEVNGEVDSKTKEMSDEESGNKDKNGDHEQPSADSNSTNDSSEKEQKLESSTSSSAAAAEQVEPSSSSGSAGVLVRKYKERFGGEDGAIQLAKVFFPTEDPSYNEDEDPDFVEEDEEGDDEEEEEETEVDGEGDEEVGDEEGAEEDEEEEEEDEDFDEADLGTLLGSTEGTKAGFDSGSTACVALVYKNRIIVANIGDSRAVLCRGGKAMDLSEDHKPEDAKEKKRIMAAGGKVGEDGRVNGGLNLSRAFGDHYYKQKSELPLEEQMITSLPDVTSTETVPDDEFLVIACDGIWNSMSSQQCCDFIMERIGKMELKEITAEICEHCCAKDTAGDGSGCDNETVILIDLKKNQRPKISPKECTSPELVAGTNSEVEEAKEANGGKNGEKKEEGENAE